MVRTVTVPPVFSRIERAVSSANRSYGLVLVSPDIRFMAPVSGSISTLEVAGTCFIHTTIFIFYLLSCIFTFIFRFKTLNNCISIALTWYKVERILVNSAQKSIEKTFKHAIITLRYQIKQTYESLQYHIDQGAYM